MAAKDMSWDILVREMSVLTENNEGSESSGGKRVDDTVFDDHPPSLFPDFHRVERGADLL